MNVPKKNLITALLLSVIIITGMFSFNIFSCTVAQASETIEAQEINLGENYILTAQDLPREQSPAQGQRPGQKQNGELSRGNGSAHMPGGMAPKGNMPPQEGQQPNSPDIQGRGQFGGQQIGRMGSANSKYATPLFLYSAAFFILVIGLLLLNKLKIFKINESSERTLLLIILGVALVIRVIFANTAGGHNDLSLFRNWAATAARNLLQVYSDGRNSSDYPPLYIYILYLLGKLIAIQGLSSYATLIMKLPAILADAGTAYLVYKLGRNYLSVEIGLLLSVLYAFNPVILVDSVFWGQVDSILVFLMVLALYNLMEERIGLSACFFAAAVLMKPQGIIIAPVLLFELIRKRDLKAFAKACACGLATAAVVILPFALTKGPLWIFKLYTGTISEYPKASINAFNYFALIGANYASDTEKLLSVSFHTWGMIAIILVTVFSGFLYLKSRSVRFAPASALLLVSGVFTFATSMHERYLYPAVAMAILAYICLKDRRLLIFIYGFSITSYVNVQSVLYGTLTAGKLFPFGTTQTVIAILNIALFIYLAIVLKDLALRKKASYSSEAYHGDKLEYEPKLKVKNTAGHRRPVAFIVEKAGCFFTDWILIVTLAATIVKSIMLTGRLLFDDDSIYTRFFSYTNISDPLFYISFIIILFSVSYIFAKRSHAWYLAGLDVFLSILYILDLWYLRGYANFMTVSLALHTLNFRDIVEKTIPNIRMSDFLYILDCLIIFAVLILRKNMYTKMKRSIPLFILISAVSVGYISVSNKAAVEQHQNLFDVLWAPGETILNLSPLGYHAFDAYDYLKECTTVKLKEERVEAIKDWFEEKKEDSLPDNKYKGMFKGKNLIYIQVESFENFVINQSINDKEITPNINGLLNNSLYFTNYRDETNHGNSSDADLLINASVYPLKEGGTFMLHPYTTFNSLPKLLGKQGYSTLAVKPDQPSGWNWVQALTSMGYQRTIDIRSFNVDEKIGLGLSDGSYFRQLAPMLEKQKQPFFTYLVTLSSHSPFELPEKYRELQLGSKVEYTSIGGYLESVHYTDKQIGYFLEELKKSGTLNNTVVIITGDHQGIHKGNYHDNLSSEERQSWWDSNDRRLPFIVYYNGLKGEKIEVNGGQIDTLPTLAYLFGIDEKEISDTAMGRNLLKTGRNYSVYSNDGGTAGTFKDETERKNALEGLNIADDIIKSDYFSKYK